MCHGSSIVFPHTKCICVSGVSGHAIDNLGDIIGCCATDVGGRPLEVGKIDEVISIWIGLKLCKNNKHMVYTEVV